MAAHREEDPKLEQVGVEAANPVRLDGARDGSVWGGRQHQGSDLTIGVSGRY